MTHLRRVKPGMANNLESYQRFTALPPNIAKFGSTVEELALQQGKPDPNPVLSPMPEQRVAGARLSLSPSGSDKLRLALPQEPAVNPYEGPRSNLGLTRNALRKLRGKVVSGLLDAIDEAAIDDEVKHLMGDSIRRALIGLGDYLDDSIRLSEGVYARCIAASKG